MEQMGHSIKKVLALFLLYVITVIVSSTVLIFSTGATGEAAGFAFLTPLITALPSAIVFISCLFIYFGLQKILPTRGISLLVIFLIWSVLVFYFSQPSFVQRVINLMLMMF